MGMQSGTSGWTVTLHRDAPLDVTGYTSMRLALYFEKIAVGDPHGLLFYVNDPPPQSRSHRRPQSRSHRRPRDRRCGVRAGEQIVEIPLDEFKLRRPYIESLRIRGPFSRQLYIDELGLVDDA
jgi:hypothetical protein